MSPRLLVALCACLACAGSQRAPAGPPVALSIEALDGGSIDIARYRGRVVVVHVFTTWSLGAQGDVPQLVEAAERFADRVRVIGVALDPDGHELVAPWRRANAIPYLVGLATPELLARAGLGAISGVPATVIIDRYGRVVHTIERPLADRELIPLLERIHGRR